MDKDRFQPSLLRGLYRTESVPVSWDEVYRLITEDEMVKQQTELYRSTRDEKYKHTLPAVTTAVQLDGKGKAMENIVGYTGVTHCDLDHVPVERLGEVLGKIKADPHTFLCNVSPSGNGVHIYAKYSVEDMDLNANYQKMNRKLFEKINISADSQINNFTDNLRIIDGNSRSQIYDMAFMAMNCYYADLLGLPFDEQCSNPNKTLSLSHDAKAYYNPNAEVFKVNANYQKIDREFFLRFAMKASQSAERIEKLSIPFQENNFTENLRTIVGNSRSYKEKHHGRYVKNYLDPIEFAEEYVRNRRGLTYTEGCRNAYLYECLNMMNLLGVPRTDAESWLHGFDLPEREKMSVLKSAYKRTADFGKFELPYTWKEEPYTSRPGRSQNRQTDNLTKDSHAHTRGTVHCFPDYQWPHFIQQMLDCADSKPQRDVMLLAVFAVLGAMIGRLVRVKYSKRFWHPALQVFIVAPPASGKSVIGWVRHLAEPLHDKLMSAYEAEKKLYDKDKAAYDNAGKERANMECPVAPAMKMFLIAGNNSSTGILENLADAEGHALICESEADTLSAAINADYGNWDDTLRKAHDHDRLAYNRRTNKEYRQIPHPCLGVLICGTPAQVRPLIPSAENGLFSRQIFGSLPAISSFVNQFDEEEESEDMDTLFYQWGREWLSRLDKLKAETSSIRMRLTREQQEEFNRQFSQLFHHADATQPSHHMMASVAREAINMLRIMEVVALVRAMEDTQANCTGFTNNLLQPAKDIPAENLKDGITPRYDLFVTDDDFHAVVGLAESIYRTACDMLLLLPSAEAVRNPQSAEEMLMASLPLQFSRKDAIDAGMKVNLKDDHVDKILSRLFKDGKLLKPSRGQYEFAFSNDVQPSRVRV